MNTTKKRAAIPALIAAVLAAVALLPTTRAATDTPTFEATFDTADDFYDRFDYGLSGVSQSEPSINGQTLIHGDHNDACQDPTTLRDVHLTGSGTTTDFSDMFWHCAPDGPDTGHLMTGLDTAGYNHLWFAPKPTFTGITKVCWDLNETEMSSRKWTELQFVSDADARRYPTGSVVDSGVWARGTGGFDLGYTDIGFRGGTNSGPTTGLVPQGGTLAGLKNFRSIFSYFQNQDEGTSDGVGWPGNLGNGDPGGTDKATRYKHCLSNNANGTMTLLAPTPNNLGRTLTLAGQIPQDSRRVVFHDSVYDAPKGEDYHPDFLTWHWDNIQVFTGDGTPPTSSTSTTSTSTTSTTSTSTTSTTTTPPVEPAVDWRTTTTGFDGWIGTERVFKLTLRPGFTKPWRLTSSLGYRPGLSFLLLSEADAEAEAQWQAFKVGTRS